MALVTKNDITQIFAIQAPLVDLPPTFANYPRGWDTARSNNGKPTIKQFNYLQQRTDQNVLWIHQNGAALPYDAAMEYAEGAVVVKDGELQKKQGALWVSATNKGYNLDYFATGKSYPLHAEIMLTNGDIVRSAVANNIVDPNVDMTGWVSSNLLHVVQSTEELQTLQPSPNRQTVHTLSFYSGLNKGGASYKYDATKASINNGTTVFNGWVLVLKPNMDVFQFGAKADNGDNTTYLQSAINYGVKSLDIPEIFTVTTLQVTSPITIHGVGGLIKTVARNDPLLSVSANDVTINGIHLRGSSYGSTVNATVVSDNGIFVNGGNTATPIKNLTIKNCEIDGFCGFGVRAEYIKNAKVYGNTVLNCGYSGVTLTSAVDSIVVKNRIDNIQSSSGATNWYGISLTRNPLQSLTDSIRSTSCIVANNIVSNVPKWTGIDTHAPDRVLIMGNRVYGCKHGIYSQYDSSSATYKMPAENLVISDNVVDGTTLADSGYGIASLGLAGMPNNNITIKSNLIIGCGWYSNTRGAIHVTDTNNGDVSGNNIVKSVRVGMSLAGACNNVEFKDNIINGVIDGASVSSSAYLYVDYRNGLTNCKVSRNKFLSNSTSEYKPYIGIFYEVGGSGVVYDKNRMSDLNGATFLRKAGGSGNIYTDLKWVFEEESVSFNYTTVGGSKFEGTGDQGSLFRRLPNTAGTPILISSTLLNQPTANNQNYSVRGNYGGVFTPAVYRQDGTNTVAGVVFNDIVLSVKGVYWTD